jgi:hypothetical protein
MDNKDWSSPFDKETRFVNKVFFDGFWLPIKNLEKEEITPSTVVGYELYFDKLSFKDHISDYIKKRSDSESPKFNIKIRKTDLLLIDEIAQEYGNTRAEVINYLLYKHLLNELKSVNDSGNEKDNKKLQMLLAAKADAIANKATYPKIGQISYFDPMGWCGDLLGDVLEKVFSDFYNYGEMRTSTEDTGKQAKPSDNKTETYKKIYEKLMENDEVEDEEDDE